MKQSRKKSKKLMQRIIAWEATINDLKRNTRITYDPYKAFKRPGSQKK